MTQLWSDRFTTIGKQAVALSKRLAQHKAERERQKKPTSKKKGART